MNLTAAFCKVIFLSCSLLILSCVAKNSLIVGHLPREYSCIAVMPFVTKGDAGRVEKEFLSDFLVSDLNTYGVTGLIYPKEIRVAYEKAGVKYPSQSDWEYASSLAKVLGCDAALWGNIEYSTIVEKVRDYENRVYLVAVEAFLVDSVKGYANWHYDSKKTSSKESDINILSEISSEMVWGLLRNPDRELFSVGGKCVKTDIDKKIRGWLAPGKSLRRVAVEKQRAKEKKWPQKLSPDVLSESERGIYDLLVSGKKVTLTNLEFSGRTADLSKRGILYLLKLAKVFKVMGPDGYTYRLESHVDATDDGASDMKLSLDRVKNVKAFLLNNLKLSDRSLNIKAFGGEIPLLPNVSKRSRQKNRRIELSVSRTAM